MIYLVSGSSASEHLQNLERQLQRLKDKGLRCRKEKCKSAQQQVEYLGHVLSSQGITKSPEVDTVTKMPPSHDISTLKSFLGSVQFHGKFLPTDFATAAEPLYDITKKIFPRSGVSKNKILSTSLKVSYPMTMF